MGGENGNTDPELIRKCVERVISQCLRFATEEQQYGCSALNNLCLEFHICRDGEKVKNIIQCLSLHLELQS